MYDVIIVGSGAGGAAAAYRLTLSGLTVLILEKGLQLPHDGSTMNNERVVTRGEFLSKEPWTDGRGRAICPQEHFNLGGKTKWYGAAVLRYAPEEFRPDEGHGARGWPIRHDELIPYYEEAEELLGVCTFPCEPGLKRILDRLTRIDSAWQSMPLPMALSRSIVNDPGEATHFDGFASAANLKGDAEESFLKPVENRSTLSIRTGAEVQTLLPKTPGQNSPIAGVKLTNGEEIYAPTVLLAAGALHSPRLLARYLATNASANASASAPMPAAFSAVGRNLKKHVLTALVAVSWRRQSDQLRKTMLTTHTTHRHSSVQPLGFDSELIATLIPPIVPRFIARMIGRHSYGFFLQTEDGSHPDNRVLERGSPPTRVMDYDADRLPASQTEHRQFTRAFWWALLRLGFVSFTQRVGLDGTAHVDGTLIAGTDPDDSVVDATGAVFGIEGLYVVDGSILPRSSRVNPSLSIYAWSLRVADLLIKRRRDAPSL
jgi:choline dehydrogenase-like flavoprotein